ncbi:MAG TPA: histidine kinase [archaeon]|nr:histidine kinase [archaeon]
MASYQPRFQSFWWLQLAGWGTFYLLLVLATVPVAKDATDYRDQAISIGVLFLGSFLLRPVCRYLLRGPHSWLNLEIRAAGISVLAGAIVTAATGLVMKAFRPLEAVEWVQMLIDSSVVFFLWCTLYFNIKQWQRSVDERERLLRAEAETREARLSALRYQLNPHFLFNSLNAVSTLILEGKATEASRMLAQIGEFLRSTLDTQVALEVPLSQEVTLAAEYLAIEQTRLGERLQVRWDIAPDTLDARVPSLLLQPLIENAVRYGIAPLASGGIVAVRTELCDSRLRLTVSNSGAPNGDRPEGVAHGNGIGLANSRERLRTLYGTAHTFALETLATGGCKVTIEIPRETAAA